MMDTTTNDTLSHNQITLLNIQLKADIQAAYGNVRSHEVKLQGLTKQNSKLQQEIESIRNISYKEINEVRKLNERLQHNIKSLEEDLRKEKIQFDQRNEQLQEDIKTLEEHFRKEKTSSHKDKEQLMNRIRSIEDENNTLNATVLKLTSAYEDICPVPTWSSVVHRIMLINLLTRTGSDVMSAVDANETVFVSRVA